MFKFKGISSEEMGVIIEEEEHFLAKASQRTEIFSIEGHDGDVIRYGGYSSIERPIKVQILKKEKLDAIFSWLNGSGELEYKDRITNAHFYQAIEPIRTAAIKVADFMFTRDPFWYKKNDSFIEIKDTVENIGSIYCEPILRLEKGEEDIVEVTIAGVRFTYEFKNDEYVEIDCMKKNAYHDGVLRNRQLTIGYDFPVLQVGKNQVIIHRGDPIIKIKRKDCWL